MKFARLNQIDKIYQVYEDSPIFDHVDKKHLVSFIKNKQAIWEEGVVITFSKHKRSIHLGDYILKRDECHLNHIINRSIGNGKTQQIFDKFVKYIKSDIVLLCRDNNKRAMKFYKKNGFKKVGKIEWNIGMGSVMKRTYRRSGI